MFCLVFKNWLEIAKINVQQTSWMKYSSKRIDENDNYDTFLDELNFLSNNLHSRIKFVNDFINHVNYFTFKYARQFDNERELNNVVFVVFNKYNAKCWNSTKSRHFHDRLSNKNKFNHVFFTFSLLSNKIYYKVHFHLFKFLDLIFDLEKWKCIIVT